MLFKIAVNDATFEFHCWTFEFGFKFDHFRTVSILFHSSFRHSCFEMHVSTFLQLNQCFEIGHSSFGIHVSRRNSSFDTFDFRHSSFDIHVLMIRLPFPSPSIGTFMDPLGCFYKTAVPKQDGCLAHIQRCRISKM